jgi:NAD(P)-dependent dehydrogenase (short-subunit alcohol dehydrogenase family)
MVMVSCPSGESLFQGVFRYLCHWFQRPQIASPTPVGEIRVVGLDVNSDKSLVDAIDRINEESKRIDVLVNNTGYSRLERWRISRWMKLRPSLRQLCLVP